ncbi:MAG: NTP transferase domain-containing protein [Chloroflexi bacterium]|nr:NTP transferase domain-containing protein [Chloroflexota bacterium]
MTPVSRTAIILVGGQGARLRPFTEAVPKPMLPIGARPILEINIEYLKAFGFNEIVLATGYMKDYITHYFGNGEKLEVRIRYSEDKTPLGTGGAVKQAGKGVKGPFVVVLGDGLADIDYRALLQYHKESKAVGTLVVFERRLQIPYGVLKMDVGHENAILALEEKPELTFSVNTGIIVLEPEALSYMAEGEYLRMPDLILRVKEHGKKAIAYQHRGNWIDIGQNVEQYLAINRDILEGKITFNNTLTSIILGGNQGGA